MPTVIAPQKPVLSNHHHAGKKVLPSAYALKAARWDQMVHLPPKLAADVMGVPTYQAENNLRRAASRKSRQERTQEAEADFKRCPLAEVKAPTTMLYKLMTGKRMEDRETD